MPSISHVRIYFEVITTLIAKGNPWWPFQKYRYCGRKACRAVLSWHSLETKLSRASIIIMLSSYHNGDTVASCDIDHRGSPGNQIENSVYKIPTARRAAWEICDFPWDPARGKPSSYVRRHLEWSWGQVVVRWSPNSGSRIHHVHGRNQPTITVCRSRHSLNGKPHFNDGEMNFSWVDKAISPK